VKYYNNKFKIFFLCFSTLLLVFIGFTAFGFIKREIGFPIMFSGLGIQQLLQAYNFNKLEKRKDFIFAIAIFLNQNRD
jgi:type III secretory pathway component EscR